MHGIRNPEAERIAKLFERLGEMQRLGEGPRFMLKISGGKAKIVVLNETDATVHDLSKAREQQRDRNLRKPPSQIPPVP